MPDPSGRTASVPSPISPVVIDYGGTEPAEGDHIVIPAALYADLSWLAGAASITMPDSKIVQRVQDQIGALRPVIRFGPSSASDGDKRE